MPEGQAEASLLTCFSMSGVKTMYCPGLLYILSLLSKHMLRSCCRDLQFQLSEERQAVGIGVRKTAVVRAWMAFCEGSLPLLKRTSDAFTLVSQEPPVAAFWPPDNLSRRMLEDLVPLAQLIVLTVAWDIAPAIRLARLVILALLLGPTEAVSKLTIADMAEYDSTHQSQMQQAKAAAEAWRSAVCTGDDRVAMAAKQDYQRHMLCYEDHVGESDPSPADSDRHIVQLLG